MMEQLLEGLILLLVFAMFWTLAGFPFVLWVVSLFAGDRLISLEDRQQAEYPFVSIIVSAFNEENVIGRRIENLLAQDYPPDKLEIIAGSDGSTDRTGEIIEEFSKKDRRVVALVFQERRGKTTVIGEGVERSRGEVIVFTDANTLFEKKTVRKLVEPYRTGRDVGMTAGDLVYRDIHESTASQGESLYWKYETLLKRLESRVGTLVMVAGAVYSIRRELFTEVPASLADDSFLPFTVIKEGYKIRFVESAKAYEVPGMTIREEWRRRYRMVPQDVRAYWHFRGLAGRGTWKAGLILFSHKFLRWNIGNILILVFILLAFAEESNTLNDMVYYGISLLSCLALTGGLGERTGLLLFKKRVFSVPFYLLSSIFVASAGFWKGTMGRSEATWEVSRGSRNSDLG